MKIVIALTALTTNLIMQSSYTMKNNRVEEAVPTAQLNLQLFDLIKKRAPTEEIQKILDKGGEINACDEYGFTVFLLAAELGATRTCTFLYEKGAQLNAAIEDLWNEALHRSARKGQTELCMLLIKMGADINAINLKNEYF